MQDASLCLGEVYWLVHYKVSRRLDSACAVWLGLSPTVFSPHTEGNFLIHNTEEQSLTTYTGTYIAW